MSTVAKAANPEADPRVKAVFDDIRATRQTDFINNMWQYLAFDADLLEQTWAEVKAVMASPSALDPLTKELIYIAVSISNSCNYCAHSHAAAARAKGMSSAQYADLLRIVGLAAKTNHLATALQVPVDAAFDAAFDAERQGQQLPSNTPTP
ncbi:carboxymuconolactone decarboxylase family protein [Allofranklinella schreckenbergeri]|uniref:Carboxymuconolactone decarboxylase family protein n=1 Tax=Allofranklinella schreckenbergeri TaxID=1076744 RepID=A0A3M6R6W6_9BURK|nr:carboxymuconolactone decarboxylase family protein [Allofranklinella schreckenbergeri]RMX02060.1 carboxymuconolactone decarboxylase family protein [Allofranklinella schreckenbergeri]RMX11101.1 carboxymuconolactone decarboxylase family protein [Allofranklinella schreckenbergeri]RRD40575.1 carboxymuconolactone decarboxylase family protein [Comamonadaceae bacterium OH3737_COT-264]